MPEPNNKLPPVTLPLALTVVEFIVVAAITLPLMFPVPLTIPLPNNTLPPVMLAIAEILPPVLRLPTLALPVTDKLPNVPTPVAVTPVS